MKNIIYALAISFISTLGYTQSVDVGSIEDGTLDLSGKKIRNKLSDNGPFVIVDSDDYLKLLIRENGEVNWFLDKNDMFIRDGFFEAFPGDPLTQYDFIYIDGGTGRIGFNVLSDTAKYDELPLTSSIHLYGSLAYRVRRIDLDNTEVSTRYDIQQDDHILILEEPNQDREMYLPFAANCKGRKYIFKRTGEGNAKIDILCQTGDFIDGDKTSIELGGAGDGGTLVSDGIGWWQVTEDSKLEAAFQPSGSDIELTNEDFVEIDLKTAENKTVTVVLPNANQHDGSEIEIKRNDYDPDNVSVGNSVEIKPLVGQSIDSFTNASPYIMSNDWESVKVRSNGSRWLIINAYNH